MKKLNPFFRYSLYIIMTALVYYGGVRAYYSLTDGFLISNITSEYAFDPRWETRPLDGTQSTAISALLDQPFHYLGKGCQSYVFESEDGKYVLKFFKYHRFKTKPWVDFFSFIPFVARHRQERIDHKNGKREGVFNSWRLAFDHLQGETGVVFVHLNKTHHLGKKLVIFDKLGIKHQIEADDVEFLLQKRAYMLCDVLEEMRAKGAHAEAENLLSALVQQLLAEYERGLADNDHALMQNTGVADGQPVHVDVGQFVLSERVKDPEYYMQELYTKMYKFRLWLAESYPELAMSFDGRLRELYGEKFEGMRPMWKERIED